MDNEARAQEILKRRGLDVTPVENFTETDVPEPSERFTKLINIYYSMKNTVDMEIPYWYNRVWWENEGDVTEIRRAKAYGAALSHTMRGELATYSERTEKRYHAFVLSCREQGRNLTTEVRENQARLQGWRSLEDVERSYRENCGHRNFLEVLK